MNIRKRVNIIIFVLAQQLFGQVVIEKINIYSEFFSVFNKTRVELFLYNPTYLDSLEKTIILKINQSSIVTDLWLEIDSTLKKAETLSSTTGERIYNRITRRRIDPALMRKQANGIYSLRVFPINIKQKRKVVVEYYSILESNFTEKPSWHFESESSNITFNISGKVPQGNL